MAMVEEPHPEAATIIATARSCVGAKFRPQGRGPDAFDCLGLAHYCAAAAGIRLAPPPAYSLRYGAACCPDAALLARGFVPRFMASGRAGDLLVSWCGDRQVHVAILTGTGVVEADATLRRVVERPEPAGSGALRAWRFPDGER
jgi:lipoprotein Spr